MEGGKVEFFPLQPFLEIVKSTHSVIQTKKNATYLKHKAIINWERHSFHLQLADEYRLS